MLETLYHLGHRLMHLFGEPDLGVSGISPRQSQEMKESLSGHLFSDLLPYEWYEEEHGLFLNQNSLGFAIEICPLAGCEEAHEKEIHHLFEEILEEGASIQCLLFADHRTHPFLSKWQECSSSKSIFKEMTQKRIEFFEQAKKNTPRLFRCVFSYTIPLQGIPNPFLLKSLETKKEKMLRILASLSHGFCWTAKHLLEFVGGLVNFSLETERKQIEWNPYQTLLVS